MTQHRHVPSDGRVFVFGSNVRGFHGRGAAAYAARVLGARYGIGEGAQGRSYALPTCSYPGHPLPLATIRGHVERFLAYARANPATRFFVSEVGCGLAGYTPADIAPMFGGAPPNCDLPPAWEVARA